MWILLLHLFLSPIFYFFNLRDRWSCIRLNEKNMHAKFFLRLLTGGTFRHVPPLWLRAWHSWLRCLMALSTCGSQVVYLKRFWNVCVQRAHVTGCSLCPPEHSYFSHFSFSS